MIYVIHDKRNHLKTAVTAESRREAIQKAERIFTGMNDYKIRAKIKKTFP